MKENAKLHSRYLLPGLFFMVVVSFFFLAELIPAEPLKSQDPVIGPVAGPHKDLSCEDCHTVHGERLLDDSGTFCLKCHKDAAGEDSHPTDIQHEGPPPKGLPLSKEGKITCYTCHVLHETMSSSGALLRKKFDDLCISCHFPRESAQEQNSGT